MSHAVVEIFTMSAPVACILATRSAMASGVGVLWKLWDETMTLNLSGFFPSMESLNSWTICKTIKARRLRTSKKQYQMVFSNGNILHLKPEFIWQNGYLKLNINIVSSQLHCQTKCFPPLGFITLILTTFQIGLESTDFTKTLINWEKDLTFVEQNPNKCHNERSKYCSTWSLPASDQSEQGDNKIRISRPWWGLKFVRQSTTSAPIFLAFLIGINIWSIDRGSQ